LKNNIGDHMKNNHLIKASLLALISTLSSSCLLADESNFNKTLIVTAELEDSNVLELANSVTVIDEEAIQNKNAQHLSDLLNLAPNVNFATGASRGRFIQIRGIGERSEFKEPINSSVGVMLDGIDLTGISTAATTLDIQQVEILRGPQGTLYGANGLAGLINLVSNSPTENNYSKLSASVESYGGLELSGVVSGPLSDTAGYRFAVKQYQSDGFMDNEYLNRSDTNNIDELSLRGKVVSQLSDSIELTTSVFLADIDNGYDAFSLDSNRTTLSDEPGFDRQNTKAVAFNLDWEFNTELWLETTLSHANSELDYAYDEDWSHTGICNGTACDSAITGEVSWYSSFDQFQRDNKNTSIDLKLHSNASDSTSSSWVAGFYFRDQKVDLTRKYTYQSNDFTSEFDTKNIAFYGQLETPLSNKVTLVSGLRFEQRHADYLDNNLASFSPNENLWGGKVSLEYQYEHNKMVYALISRGYKAGGFNTDASIEEKDRLFETEFMWNYEAGIKGVWLNNRLVMQAAVFYQDRKDIQTKQSIVRSLDSGLTIQEGGVGPFSFTDLTSNAATGSSKGLEFEARYQASDNLNIYSTIGLLYAQFDEFLSYTHVDADLSVIPPIPADLRGKDVAHAPNHQVTLGGNYFFTEQLSFKTEVEVKDSFGFSDRHNLKSESYSIINLALTYQQTDWRISLYANNVTDKDIQTRGFGSFGNDPRNFYATGNYFQFAAPRVVGITFSKEFE
jgi:iron complex outermembrane receptor protein